MKVKYSDSGSFKYTVVDPVLTVNISPACSSVHLPQFNQIWWYYGDTALGFNYLHKAWWKFKFSFQIRHICYYQNLYTEELPLIIGDSKIKNLNPTTTTTKLSAFYETGKMNFANPDNKTLTECYIVSKETTTNAATTVTIGSNSFTLQNINLAEVVEKDLYGEGKNFTLRIAIADTYTTPPCIDSVAIQYQARRI
ncbi:MAG: hypothetical protein ACOYWZ_09550 [Bacillota bacterium]